MEDNIKTRYFPALCATCARCFLAALPLAEARSITAVCPRCGGAGKLLPGALYSPADRVRFERLEVAFSAAQLTREQAATLAVLLERAARDDTRRRAAIDAVLSSAPQLQGARQLLPYSLVELHQFVGIAIVLLSSIAQVSPGQQRFPNPPSPPLPLSATQQPTGSPR
jgi:hypothetical protein